LEPLSYFRFKRKAGAKEEDGKIEENGKKDVVKVRLV
jgi:hypothetical protein